MIHTTTMYLVFLLLCLCFISYSPLSEPDFNGLLYSRFNGKRKLEGRAQGVFDDYVLRAYFTAHRVGVASRKARLDATDELIAASHRGSQKRVRGHTRTEAATEACQ